MPAHELASLWRAIDVIESQEDMRAMNTSLVGQMKPEAFRAFKKKLYDRAYPRDVYKREAKDAKFLLSKLGG